MEIFKSCRQYLMNVGINTHQSTRKHPFNARNVLALTVSALCVTSNIIFLLYDTETFEEYISTLYSLSTAMICKITFMIAMWKMKKLFEIFDGFQCVIGKSE